MQPRGPLHPGRAPARHLCPQQAGGEEGEQVPEVLGVHVEPAVLGHGGRRHHGHRSCQWRTARLAGLCGDHHPAHHQLHNQLHRGEQCRQCCGRSHGPARPQGEAALTGESLSVTKGPGDGVTLDPHASRVKSRLLSLKAYPIQSPWPSPT